MTDLLKNSIITCIEMHVSCIALIILLYINIRNSLLRIGRKNDISLILVYMCSALMLLSDCCWTCVSSLCIPGDFVAYLINLVYFISSSTAAACWFLFCIRQLDAKFFSNKLLYWVTLIPYAAVSLLYLLSTRYSLIFYIENGSYIRGNIFYIETIIKMSYIIIPSVLSFVYGLKRELGYQRTRDFNFALFGIPVVIGGILQTITGVDFICLGVCLGLILIYIAGITNPDSENTDAIYSLANSFEASYIVNMDTGVMRPLHQDIMHDKNDPAMQSMDYTTHFVGVLSKILLPEDKANTLESFDINNVAKRFKIDNSFNVRYRVKESSGQSEIHMAYFIRATGDKGKQEFLIGINTIHADSLLYERNENLNHENQRLEQINSSIIESVAKIVEARDSGSGEHIVRVKRLTEIIAKEIMNSCPEYNLDEDRIKLISSASVLHDVGKIVVPDAVLLKPGKLTAEEFEIMKTHTTKGCDVLNMFPLGLDDAFLECALSICRWHHEKYDGKGYPDGLKGEEIPIAAQIVSVADCLDALVNDRPYKKAYSPEKSFEMIKNGECGAFSPKIINALENQKNKLMEMVRLYK